MLAPVAEKEKKMESSHRINAVFSGKTFSDLETLAKAKGKSKTDVLRDAVALEKWFQDAQEEGGRVLVERDGELREIIPR
jgi:hypothetical protein